MNAPRFALPRRGLLIGLGVAAAAPAIARAAPLAAGSLAAMLRALPDRPGRIEVGYRGVHYGTHNAVHYETLASLAWNDRGGRALLEVDWAETHDGDVLDGPNALPRSRRRTVIDTGAGQVVTEGLSVIDKPVDWRFDYDRAAGRVSGHMERYGPRTAFAGPAGPDTTSGDGLVHLIASLPLQPGYEKALRFIAPGGAAGIGETPVRVAVMRRQFMRVSGEELTVLRVSVTSEEPFVPATGVYLVRERWPHLVLRSEYQSTHVEGKPAFDSRGCDVITSVRLLD